jgi:hypothetical protein
MGRYNMRKKIWIFSITAAILLILTFFPTQPVSSTVLNKKNAIIETYKEIKTRENTIKLKIYHIKEDGTYVNAVKELTSEENKALKDELRQTEKSGTPIREIFEKKLGILKKYELVSSDLTLDDVLDVSKLRGTTHQTDDDDEFEEQYAPIVFAGGGLGFGFGLPSIITSGTFLVILFGFGAVYCYNIYTGVTHQLMTLFFIPMLIGYLGGFIGLLLLPVIPGFFYSNLFGLGFVSKTRWMLVPSTNLTAA